MTSKKTSVTQKKESYSNFKTLAAVNLTISGIYLLLIIYWLSKSFLDKIIGREIIPGNILVSWIFGFYIFPILSILNIIIFIYYIRHYHPVGKTRITSLSIITISFFFLAFFLFMRLVILFVSGFYDSPLTSNNIF